MFACDNIFTVVIALNQNNHNVKFVAENGKLIFMPFAHAFYFMDLWPKLFKGWMQSAIHRIKLVSNGECYSLDTF